LSPAAAAFTPDQYSSAHNATESTASHTSYLSTGSGQTIAGGVSISGVPRASHLSVSQLLATSIIEAYTYPHYINQGAFDGVGAIGDPAADIQHVIDAFGQVRVDNRINNAIPSDMVLEEPYLHEVNIAIGAFTTDETSTRALMVTGVASNVSWISIAQAFNVSPLIPFPIVY
jgi:hypothetical protein